MALLKITGMSKNFGALQVLRDINLEVQEGSLHSVVGPNGAGKTTFFNFFLFVLLFFLLAFLFVRRLIESPFGKVLMGMRESELRATAIGYNPETYKWIAFILSAMICGLGGALFALHQEYVGEHLADWFTSGEIVIMALLGGVFVLYGAPIGAGLFIFLADFLNKFIVLSQAGPWLLIFGVIFILVVMFLRGGIYGGALKVWEAIKGSRRETSKAGDG